MPSLSGVTGSVLNEPGTASSFWPNCGTQNECVTSSDVIRSLAVESTGSFSVAEVSPPKSGYLKVQANCCEITLTWTGLSGSDAAEACGMCSFCARTTALTIEMAVTSAAGTAVQAISRRVLPWIGGAAECAARPAPGLKDR